MTVGTVSSSSGVLAAGVRGVQTGLARANEAAGQIANYGTTNQNGDLVTPIVNLKSSELQVKASAAVIQTAAQVMGTLIDIKA